MSSFEPNNRHLRELLIYFLNFKKQFELQLQFDAAEAHRLLVETYGEAALSYRCCREWFQKFKNGGFDIEDKERSGRPKERKTKTRNWKHHWIKIRKMKRSSGKGWIILQVKHKIPYFRNKCPIIDKKRRKLICAPDILSSLSTFLSFRMIN